MPIQATRTISQPPPPESQGRLQPPKAELGAPLFGATFRAALASHFGPPADPPPRRCPTDTAAAAAGPPTAAHMPLLESLGLAGRRRAAERRSAGCPPAVACDAARGPHRLEGQPRGRRGSEAARSTGGPTPMARARTRARVPLNANQRHPCGPTQTDLLLKSPEPRPPWRLSNKSDGGAGEPRGGGGTWIAEQAVANSSASGVYPTATSASSYEDQQPAN